jgi:hypothetical protein
MVLQAIIESLDYVNNTCTVNIPALQLNPNASPVIRTAVTASTPGIIHGYKVGDRVWVGFINGQPEYPVVLGKLTSSSTALDAGGTFKGQSIVVSDSATLPSTINFTGVDADYNSLNKIIYKLKQATSFATNHKGLDYQLKELAESGGNGGGSSDDPTPVIPDQDVIMEAVQAVVNEAVDAALWSTITSVLTSEDWARISAAGGFEIGKVLFVKNDLNKDYYYRAKVDIYPMYSQSTDYTKLPLVEFSNIRHYNRFDKLPGNWYVKAYFNGGILVQRWDTEEETSDASFAIGTADCALFRTIEDPDHPGMTITEPQSWYWDSFSGVGLKSVLTRDLIFRDSTGKDIRESTETEICRIDVPGDLPGDASIPVQKYGNNDAERCDNFAILNIRDANLLKNSKGNPCRFKSSTNQTNIFKSIGGNNSTRGIEYIYLPDEYNKTYENNSFTSITNCLFMGANHLSYIRLPDSTGILKNSAFNGTGKNAQKPLEIANLQNSQVHIIEKDCLQNVAIKDACLYLPKLYGSHTAIKFLEGAIYWRFWTNHTQSLKTLFVQSPLDFDYNESGVKHQGSFKTFNGNTTDFINKYVKELIYRFDRQDTINALKVSELCAFFKTSTEYTVTKEDVTKLISDFEQAITPDTGRLLLELETESGHKVPVHFINAGIATDFTVGESTELTIVYNYTK